MKENKEDLPFGKRLGFEPINIPFQLESIDKTLRIELWNAHYLFIHKKIEHADNYQKSTQIIIYHTIWIHFFRNPFDDYPAYDFQVGNYIKNFIEKGPWYKVYEFFEFVLDNIQKGYYFQNREYKEYINDILKRNNSGYTLSNNKFIPITNATEINEIERTQELAKKYTLTGIQEHLNAAIELLSQKPNPDNRNSIKESISMVEAISRIIEPSASTLGKALNKLDQNHKINGTLKSGFDKLYAYTNDKNGIRHALMDDQNIGIEDARFFLISCSAFTNYLIEKAIKNKVLNDQI
jgi:hypothetical protein